MPDGQVGRQWWPRPRVFDRDRRGREVGGGPSQTVSFEVAYFLVRFLTSIALSHKVH